MCSAQTLLFLAFMIAGTSGYLMLCKRAEREFQLRLNNRMAYSDREWADRYIPREYRGSTADIIAIRNLVGRSIGVDPGKLRPTDSIFHDLSINKWYILDDTWNGILEEFRDLFKTEVKWNQEWRSLADFLFGVLQQM